MEVPVCLQALVAAVGLGVVSGVGLALGLEKGLERASDTRESVSSFKIIYPCMHSGVPILRS